MLRQKGPHLGESVWVEQDILPLLLGYIRLSLIEKRTIAGVAAYRRTFFVGFDVVYQDVFVVCVLVLSTAAHRRTYSSNFAGVYADFFAEESDGSKFRMARGLVGVIRWLVMGEGCTFAAFAPGLDPLYNRKKSFGPGGELSAGHLGKALKPRPTQRV